jgi:3',5'-cyclic AMP phosphodiesterase CpdA
MSSHLFIQMSDIHLRAEGGAGRLGDPLANLEAALAQIERSGIRPEAFILTGDLTDEGEPAAYEALRTRMEAVCSHLHADVVYVPGNHDRRSAFRQYLPIAPDDGPIRQVKWYGDCRLACLDTNVAGDDAGALGAGDLEWLAAELSRPAAGGTILALHHPPITSPIETMAALALAEPERLGAVLAGSDVCLIICGHNHHATAGLLAGIPVFVAPALAYRADALIAERFVGVVGCGFGRIDIVDGNPLVTSIPVDAVAQAAASA